MMEKIKHMLAAACWLLIAAGAYGQTPQAQSPREHHEGRVARVFDAKGVYVGEAHALDATFGVYMKIDDALVFVRIERMTNDDWTNASASRFRWKAIDCTTSTNCPDPLLVNCGGSLCPARPSMSVRRGSAVTLYVASASNSIGLNTFNPDWAIETTYDLTLHHPEPLIVRY